MGHGVWGYRGYHTGKGSDWAHDRDDGWVAFAFVMYCIIKLAWVNVYTRANNPNPILSVLVFLMGGCDQGG